MSTSSGRSRVCPKAAQRREEILDAAIRCFREKGFHAASMSSIAKAFGMSAGHIYNYFDSKEDIIEAIVNRWLDNYIHTIRIRWNPDPVESGSGYPSRRGSGEHWSADRGSPDLRRPRSDVRNCG
ncbi:MAG: TetR/AcrR family transcriptional regulator [Mesosutterella multiformis]|nr:TetR/AcrR family transcriptional regulator [Mesosutterella multiformis]